MVRLVQTRKQEKRVEMDNLEEVKEKSTCDIEPGENKNRLTKLQQWVLVLRGPFKYIVGNI